MIERSSTNGPHEIATEPDEPTHEQLVLGSIMQDSSALELIDLQPEHFGTRADILVFRGMLALREQGKPAGDYELLKAKLDESGALEEVTSKYLSWLSDSTATSANIKHYAGLVLENSQWRALELARFNFENLLKDRTGRKPDQVARSVAVHLGRVDGTDDLGSIGAGELLKLDIPKKEPLVDGWLIPRGVTLTYSKPGVGKSWLRLQLAVCRATGRDFLGLAAKPGRVGVITFEEDHADVQYRLHSICEHLKLNADERDRALNAVQVLTGEDLDDFDLAEDATVQKVIRWALKHELDQIDIDPISDAHSLNESDHQQMRRISRALRRIRNKTGAAIHLVHHDRKSSTTSGKADDHQDAARGARLVQLADWCLHLTAYSSAVKITYAKVRHGGGNRAAVWCRQIPEGEPGSGCLVLADEPLMGSALADANRAKVQDALTDDWRTADDLAEATELSAPTARKWLKVLAADGLAEHRPAVKNKAPEVFRRSASSAELPFDPPSLEA